MNSANPARRLLGVALTAACCWALASDGRAQQIWYVDVNGIPPGSGTANDPYTSVQHALVQTTTVNGDTLLVLPGTYDEVIDFVGKAVTVRSSDGPLTTILRGNPAANPPASVVTFTSGEGAGSVLEGFTVREGNGTLVSGSALGGGIYVLRAAPTLLDCVVRDNQAAGGGGAAFVQAGPTVSDCTFSNNVATFGGGIYLRSASAPDPSLQRTEILDNTASLSGGGIFAAACCPSNGPTGMDLQYCTLSGNAAGRDGGAVWYEEGWVSFFECTFANNTAGRDGGGVWCNGVFSMSFTRCRIDGNVAALYGGGICSRDSDVGLGSCRIERNSSSVQSGGGITSFGTSLGLSRSVFYANHADDFGGAVYHLPNVPNESLSLDHCTVYENVTGYGWAVEALGYVNVSNSVLWGNGLDLSAPSAYTTLQYSDVGLANVGGVGNINADPLLWDAVGGDFNLQAGSPCIDAGNPGSPLDPDGSITDMGAVTYGASYCPPTTTYCTAGTTTNGCNATISATGTASASAPSGFAVTAAGVEGQKQGILFWGLAPLAAPWGAGTSLRCVSAPVKRTGVQNSGGTSGACDGVLSLDFNTWMQTYPHKAPPAGEFVYMQAWFRDPPAPRTSNLSDGLRFAVCP